MSKSDNVQINDFTKEEEQKIIFDHINRGKHNQDTSLSSLINNFSSLKELEKILNKEILGQTNAIHTFCEGLFRNFVNQKSRNNAPITFLFVGPRGVGKYPFAKIVANKLNYKLKIISLKEFDNMSGDEVINTLIAIGGDNSIICLDDIESADDKISLILSNVIFDGTGTSGELKNTIFIIMCNAGQEYFDVADVDNSLLPTNTIVDRLIASDDFPKKLITILPKMAIVAFNPIDITYLKEICVNAIDKFCREFEEEYGIKFSYEMPFPDFLLYSLGKHIDANAVVNFASDYLRNKTMELFESFSDLSMINNLDEIRITLDKNSMSSDAKSLFDYHSDLSVLLYMDEKKAKKFKGINNLNPIIPDDFDEAVLYAKSSIVDVIVSDIFYDDGSKVITTAINPEDIKSKGRTLIDIAHAECPEKFFYIAEDKQQPFSDKFYNDFLRLGVDGGISISNNSKIKSQFKKIRKDIHLIKNFDKIKKENQILISNPAQLLSPNGKCAFISIKDAALIYADYYGNNSIDNYSFSKYNKGFDTLIGLEKMKKSFGELIFYLNSPRSYLQKNDFDLDKSFIIYDDCKGSGKTSFVKALAGESGVYTLKITGENLLNKYGMSGDSAFRDLFKMVERHHSSCIFFVDNIDELCGDSANDEFHNKACEAFCDAFRKMKFDPKYPVILFATTNDPDKVRNSSLPSIFENRIYMEELSKEDKKVAIHNLITLYRNKKIEVDLSEEFIDNFLARSKYETLGLINDIFSIAYKRIMNITNASNEENEEDERDNDDSEEAMMQEKEENSQTDKATSREKKKAKKREKEPQKVIDAKLFDEVYEDLHHGSRISVSYKDNLEGTAIHEAGHAFLRMYYGIIPEYISVSHRNRNLGYVYADCFIKDGTKESFLKELQCSLAGRAAEVVFGKGSGYNWGASSDLEKASTIAFDMISKWGFGKNLIVMQSGREDMEKMPEIRNEVNEILNNCLISGETILRENRELFEKFYKIVLEKIDMTKEDILSIPEIRERFAKEEQKKNKEEKEESTENTVISSNQEVPKSKKKN